MNPFSLEHETPGQDRSGRDQTGLVGARPVRLGQNYKYVPKDVGINFENYLFFLEPNRSGPYQTGLVPARPVWPRRFMFQTEGSKDFQSSTCRYKEHNLK